MWGEPAFRFACAQDKHTSQVRIARFGNVAQSGFATVAVLAGCQSDPGHDLAAGLEVVTLADACQQDAGGDGANAGRSIRRQLAAASRAYHFRPKSFGIFTEPLLSQKLPVSN